MSDSSADPYMSGLAPAYTIERELGGGGMSRVFLAVEAALGRRVVIKMLPHDMAASVSVERFKREISLAAQLQHPHIVPLLAAGEVSGVPYYTMPYVEGETLRARLDRGRVPLADAIRILRAVAGALGHAHGRGVVHRDIKPENILLGGDEAMVTDFGVAKALAAARDAGPTLTALGISLGTPAYMAPEQAAADAVDHRADLYGWGVVAYELLTGRHPFARCTSSQQMIAAHIAELPSAPTDLPAQLRDLVMRALAKDPARRPQSASDVVNALDTRESERVRGRRPRVWIISAAAVVAVGILVLSNLDRATDRPSAVLLPRDRVVVAPFENQSGDSTLRSLGPMVADWIAQGLAQTGVFKLVDSRIAMSAAAGGATDTALARKVGAGTLVDGAYFRTGDSLTLQARIVDAGTGEILHALEAVRVLASDPTPAFERLRQLVTAALATSADPRLREWAAKSSRPPSYAAYRSYIEGIDAFLRNEWLTAAAHYRTAHAADTNFTFALLWAATAHLNAGELRVADSITQSVLRVRDRLPPVDRAYHTWQLAHLRADREGALQAERDGFLLSPVRFAHQYSNESLYLNRLTEAKRALEPLGDDGGWMQRYVGYWNTRTQVFHGLGEHREELRAARLARASRPDHSRMLVLEARALAALGFVDSIAPLMDQARSMHAAPEAPSAARVMIDVALEFRRHGHAEAAQRTALAVLALLRDHEPSRAVTADRAVALLLADSVKGARDRYRELVAMPGDPIQARGTLGAISAALGDTAEASRADAWLSRRSEELIPVEGAATAWRARIAVQRGDLDRGAQLLRDAVGRGYRFGLYTHTDVWLEPLRNYPAFEEMMRVR